MRVENCWGESVGLYDVLDRSNQAYGSMVSCFFRQSD